MCGLACGITTLVLGAILVVSSSILGYGLMDGFIDNMIANEVAFHDDTIQLERFEEVPFALNFTIRVFNITNRDEVLAGAVPVVNEVGPYIYKLFQVREVSDRAAATLQYRMLERLQFDAEASFPRAEDDLLTIANVPYHAILQVAEVEHPELLAPLSLGLSGVFGDLNTPVATVRARQIFLDGLPICANPGFLGGIACTAIRALAADSQNMSLQPNGTILFSIFGYKDGFPSPSYKVHRGVQDVTDLGRIITFDESLRLRKWPEGEGGSVDEHAPNVCNMINGTDSGVFAPFIQRDASIYVFKSDICRSVELRYQSEVEVGGVTAARFATGAWFLDNHEGCFCLNLTGGVTDQRGCLLSGALELYSCVGAPLVMSNPHFLYADPLYQNGVIGMTPDEDVHRITVELEPRTGTVLRGGSKAQFNVFMRPISQISGTANLPNRLTPIFWVEEGVELPEEYLSELHDKLLTPLRLVGVLAPLAVVASSALLLLGVGLTLRAKITRPKQNKPK